MQLRLSVASAVDHMQDLDVARGAWLKLGPPRLDVVGASDLHGAVYACLHQVEMPADAPGITPTNPGEDRGWVGGDAIDQFGADARHCRVGHAHATGVHGVRVSEAYECPCPECSAWEAWHLDQPVPGPSWVASLRVVFLDDSGRVRYLEHVPQTDLERP